MSPTPILLPIYRRGYPIPREAPKPSRAPKGRPGAVLVFDVETTTDTEQRLLFGGYQICTWTKNGQLRVREQGMFFDTRPDGWSSEAAQIIREWVAARIYATSGRGTKFRVRSLEEFVHDILFKLAGYGDAWVVGFNLPFDLARVCDGFSVARGKRFGGGFSLKTPPRPGHPSGKAWPRRLLLKIIDTKRAFYGVSCKGMARGRFLDLRTLCHALIGESFSLKRAAEYYGITLGKPEIEHGAVTPEYLDYNANDLDMTRLLCERATADLAAHPIGLDADRAWSAASIGKGYLHAMGILPPLGRLLAVDDPIHGLAMEGYYGGRAECHIRRATVPILLVDFRSQYPTINLLMDLWSLQTAKRVRVEDCTAHARAVLADVSAERLFDPTFWRGLGFFARLRPQDDLLPIRTIYPGTTTPGIGLNYLTSDAAGWYAGPDCATSALLTRRPPEIVEAVRLVVEAPGDELVPVLFRGTVPLDPSRADFAGLLVEERARIRAVNESDPVAEGLKQLVNATTYGINVQFTPRTPGRREKRGEALLGTERTTLPAGIAENAGQYCFPYLSALTTAGGRLLLALLEHEVTSRGGTWAWADTDSMAIVAGPERKTLRVAGERIPCLSRADVEAMVARFAALNPFGGPLAGSSILKVEHDVPGEQNYTLAISAKRYAIYRLDADGRVVIVKASEHGLGHIMPPIDRAQWLKELWTYGIELALERQPVEPAWWNAPALMQLRVTQPSLAPERAFVQRYLRPLSFVLTPVVDLGGRLSGASEAGRLVYPFTKTPPPLSRMRFRDLRTGEMVTATTTGEPGPGIVRVKSLGQVVLAHLHKPEAKSCDRDGMPCQRTTRGTLHRMHVRGGRIVYTGKETSGKELSVEEPDGGDAAVFGEREDGGLGDVREALQRVPSLKALARQSGIPLRTLRALKNARTRPRKTTVERVWRALWNL